MSAHASRAPWRHREPRRRRQLESSHGTAAPFRRTPHARRGPIGSSTQCRQLEVRMAPPPVSAHPSLVSWPRKKSVAAG
eukprot:2728335-Pyramimonas_sp.AAC.1